MSDLSRPAARAHVKHLADGDFVVGLFEKWVGFCSLEGHVVLKQRIDVGGLVGKFNNPEPFLSDVAVLFQGF